VGVFERLAQIEREGGQVAVATVIQARGSVPRGEGSKMLVFADGAIEGTIGGGEMEHRVISQATAALVDGKIRTLHYRFSELDEGDPGVCGGEIDVLVEPIHSAATLIVFGAGHVGKAVARLGSWLGFRVVVADDRPGFATPENVPEAEAHITCELQELPTRIPITDRSYLVLATRGVSVDVAGLPTILENPAAYIGLIGSRRRWETCVAELRAKGATDEQLARVTSPMGLEIGAETPEEIAVSILAQMIMVRRGGSGQTMAHPVRRKSRAGA